MFPTFLLGKYSLFIQQMGSSPYFFSVQNRIIKAPIEPIPGGKDILKTISIIMDVLVYLKFSTTLVYSAVSLAQEIRFNPSEPGIILFSGILLLIFSSLAKSYLKRKNN
jgi:hypothetical protein